MRHFALGIAVALILIAMRSVHAAPQPDPDNAFLDAMTGDWSMDGVTRGNPTQYALHGARVLDDGFVRLDMIDTKTPPQYQASAYIGYDANKHDYIAHWLDQYGAAGARVVAEGRRNGNTLVVVFPYEEGLFRDTFTYEPEVKAWHWLLETQDKTGKWSLFAKYEITRK